LSFDFPRSGPVDQKVYQFAAVRRVEMIVHGIYPTGGPGFSQAFRGKIRPLLWAPMYVASFLYSLYNTGAVAGLVNAESG
jgi:hypothetical protein